MALSAKTSKSLKACTCNACGACRPAAGPKRARVVKVSAASYHSNWRSTPTTSKTHLLPIAAASNASQLLVDIYHANPPTWKRTAQSSLSSQLPMHPPTLYCSDLLLVFLAAYASAAPLLLLASFAPAALQLQLCCCPLPACSLLLTPPDPAQPCTTTTWGPVITVRQWQHLSGHHLRPQAAPAGHPPTAC